LIAADSASMPDLAEHDVFQIVIEVSAAPIVARYCLRRDAGDLGDDFSTSVLPIVFCRDWQEAVAPASSITSDRLVG
jgi:hypothetical protein